MAAAIVVLWLSFRRVQVPVRSAHAYRETITSSIATNGRIEPIQNFEAHTPLATTVKRVNVLQGNWVKAGQLILQLDDADARAQLARVQAQLKGSQNELQAVSGGGTQEELLTSRASLVKAQADRDTAQRNLQSMQRLLQSGAASQAEVDAAQVQLRVADANVHMLEQKLHDRFSKDEIAHAQSQVAEAQAAITAASDLLRNLNVVSPFAGMAYNLPVRKDSFVAAGDLLVQVADLHKVRVRIFVDEPEIGRLQVGQPVEVTWDALPGQTWKGTVEFLPTNVVLHGTRMVGEVTCILDNADLKLLPNTNVAVAIIQARHDNALTVPREAVRQDTEGKYVYQIVDGKLKRRNVQTSISNLTRVEITSGIPDDAILALGALNMQPLRDGLPVKNPN
ncbi:MAG TPA: efflux RND transporter periplasmic adaptor subunit [Candidatus Angelobacter sp.]|nr:efflux RND transporter periplasmic adaptor subunit [Candidatus Angelobacter sp.]